MTAEKLIIRLTPVGGEPVRVALLGSALWPEDAPEPEFGVLLTETPEGARYTLAGEPAVVRRLAELVHTAETHRTPRRVRRQLDAKIRAALAAASLRLQPGWPADWVAEGGDQDG